MKKGIFILINIVLVSVLLISLSGNITMRAITEFQESDEQVDEYSIINDIDYVPGLEKEILFYIFNNEHKNMQVLIRVEGELNDSITLYDTLVDFLPSEESKKFKYKFKLNRDLGPGLHKAEIIALEIPKTDSGYAGSSSKTVSELHVYVPYPGKYVEGKLEVLDAEQNATAKFIVSVINRGKSSIESVRAIIDIYTLLDEKIKTVESESSLIEVGSEQDLVTDWEVSVLPGDYVARVKLIYDGESSNFEKKFAVGAKDLSIEGILVNNFQLGEIAKLQILVENKWNQKLKEVFANLLVYDNGQVISDIKSSNEEIDALSKKELIAYWDTIGVEPGDYDGKLVINYEGRRTEKDIVLKVSHDSLDVFGIGYAVRPRGSRETNLTIMLLILIVLLLIVNLYWFISMKRRKEEKKKRRKKA